MVCELYLNKFFLAMPMACGRSRASDQSRTTAATRAASVTTQDP